MILIDSAIWAYALDKAAPEHRLAREACRRAVERDEILLPAIVELEVAHYVHRRYGKSAEVVLADWFTQPSRRRALDSSLVRSAAHRMARHAAGGIGSRDGAILAHARQDAALLVTNDGALFRAAQEGGVAVWNPTRADDMAFERWKPRPQKVIRERACGARAQGLAARHGAKGGRRKIAKR